MITSLNSTQLADYAARQMAALFPDGHELPSTSLAKAVKTALDRLDACFSNTRRGYFHNGEEACFDHLHTDQYAMFLYLLSTELYRANELVGAKKIYALNKALHGIDIYYEVRLPECFLFRHCVGTVLGRADYGDFFTVGQGCTVGNDMNQYPTFGVGVALLAGSIVIGSSKVGNNVVVAPNAQVRNIEVPNDTLVAGGPSNLQFKPLSKNVKELYFNAAKFFPLKQNIF